MLGFRKIAFGGLLLILLGLSSWGSIEAVEPTVQLLTAVVIPALQVEP